ncbi:MAG: hypothetical protein KF780_06360 [Sphingomonas sp.]|nr:hypothetical protein [Sphingomonas sp.]
MTKLNQIARTATAAIGALVISTACVAAAVGPATGNAAAPVAYASASVQATNA